MRNVTCLYCDYLDKISNSHEEKMMTEEYNVEPDSFNLYNRDIDFIVAIYIVCNL